MWTKHDLVAAFGGCCGYLDRRPLTAYLAAAGCVLAAMAIRGALGVVSPGLLPFAVLYPAFTAAALVGGLGPGLAALALGLLSSWWFPPPAAATASLPLNLALLAVTGGALVGLATTLRFAIVSLLAGRERLELAIRTTGLGTWDFDGRTGVRRWSKEFREIIGLAETAPADPTLFAQLIHPDDRERVNMRYRAAHDPAGDGWYRGRVPDPARR